MFDYVASIFMFERETDSSMGRATDHLSENVGSSAFLYLWSSLDSLSYYPSHIYVNIQRSRSYVDRNVDK